MNAETLERTLSGLYSDARKAYENRERWRDGTTHKASIMYGVWDNNHSRIIDEINTIVQAYQTKH